MPNKTIKPVLLWAHREAIAARPLSLDGFKISRPSPEWVPVVIVPLMAIAHEDNFEGHAAEFETDGIRIHVNVLASKAPHEHPKAGQHRRSRA